MGFWELRVFVAEDGNECRVCGGMRGIMRKFRLGRRAAALALAAVTACGSFFAAGCGKDKDEISYDEVNIIDDNYRTYYEIFVYSFCDSDGDGIGDLQGVISKLDYIAELGFTGIWFMPLMQSTTYHKYDTVDYYSIDEEYGTLDDFKELLAECDKRGIKVIIDLAINHTSSKHAWFQEMYNYVSGLKDGEEPDVSVCKYVDYYNIEKGKYGTSSWHRIGASDYGYEGSFWSEMPDMNLANEELRGELEDVMKFWLDLGVGGFRIDAAKEFFSGSKSKNVEVLKWLTDYCKSVKEDAYLVAEVWEGFSSYTQYYESGIDSIFGFALADSSGKIAKTINAPAGSGAGRSLADAMVQVQDTIRKYNPDAIDAPFLSNHDIARAAGYFSGNEARIKMASAVNLMFSGNAFVYYGEEIGMSGSGKDENKRLPMYWSATDGTGMTDGPADADRVESKFAPADEQMKDETSIYGCMRRAIWLRNANPELIRGDVAVMEAIEDGDICAVSKTWEDSTIYVLMNLNETEEKTISVPKDTYSYTKLCGYYSVDGSKVKLGKDKTLTLPPYSIAVLK